MTYKEKFKFVIIYFYFTLFTLKTSPLIAISYTYILLLLTYSYSHALLLLHFLLLLCHFFTVHFHYTSSLSLPPTLTLPLLLSPPFSLCCLPLTLPSSNITMPHFFPHHSPLPLLPSHACPHSLTHSLFLLRPLGNRSVKTFPSWQDICNSGDLELTAVWAAGSRWSENMLWFPCQGVSGGCQLRLR